MTDAGVRTESVKIALFFNSPRSLDIAAIVEKIGLLPESVERKGSVGPTTVKAQSGSWSVTLIAQPTRLDIDFTPNVGTDEQLLPEFGTLKGIEMLQAASDVAQKLTFHVGALVRIGVVGQCAEQFESSESATSALSKHLPFEANLPPELREVAIQFNSPVRSASVDGVFLNSVEGWQVAKIHMFAVGPAGINVSESVVLRTVYDLNTNAESGAHLAEGDAARRFLGELTGRVQDRLRERAS